MQRLDPFRADARSWPELVGKTFNEAAKKIKEDYPEAQVIQVAENSMVTMDFRLERVRVFVNAAGVVVQPPTTG
ncbi:unnamed protein product [Lymnaea stagnalis]|uniref:Uncharacterized protein n=1 Tax=Lymnaea stagnalis TaxID=6523 RepID=A0AAV2HBE8_LYMST